MEVYIVRLADGAVLSAGNQKDPDGKTIPGGPLIFESRTMATRETHKFRGSRVESRTLDYAIKKAEELGFNLWIRRADGGTSYVETGTGEVSDRLIRIEDEYDTPVA